MAPTSVISAAVDHNGSTFQPENLVTFNPFSTPLADADAHGSFTFESFDVNGCDELFDGHKREDLESAARILFHSGKRFNFSDVLAATS